MVVTAEVEVEVPVSRLSVLDMTPYIIQQCMDLLEVMGIAMVTIKNVGKTLQQTISELRHYLLFLYYVFHDFYMQIKSAPIGMVLHAYL